MFSIFISNLKSHVKGMFTDYSADKGGEGWLIHHVVTDG